MRKIYLTFTLALLVAGRPTNGSAQNAGDAINLFANVMRQAIVENARREWATVPQSQLACIEEQLRNSGHSTAELVASGISPKDPRIVAIQTGCGTRNLAAFPMQPAPSQAPLPSPYVVDGLALGSRVNFDSAAYRSYRCWNSEQYDGFTWCEWKRQERNGSQAASTTNSILHSTDGTAAYINRSIEPAVLDPNAATAEIGRLSQKFRETARVLRIPVKDGVPGGIIGYWGKIRLEPLDESHLRVLAATGSAHSGILVDYLGHFTKSARAGLPVFSVTGGPGFVWAATFDRSGKGALRFFAIDPAQMTVRVADNSPNGAQTDPAPRPQSPSESNPAPAPDCFQVPSTQPEQVIAACTEAKNAHKTKGSYERALNRLGLAYSRLNKKEEALRAFSELIASDNTSAGYYDNRREVYRSLRQWDTALSDANAAVRLAPRMAFAYQGRGDVYFDMGKFDLAASDYGAAYAQKDHQLINLFSRGRALAGAGQFENAIRDFTEVLQSDPNMTAASRARADAYISRGMLEDAERDLLSFVDREPFDAEARQTLTKVQSQLPAPKERPAIKEAVHFLDDARTFITQQGRLENIAEIGRKAADLQIALDATDQPRVIEARRQLSDLLNKIPAFGDFMRSQEAERGRIAKRQLAEAKAEAEKGVYFIDRYTQDNLGSLHSAALLKIRERLNAARTSEALSEVAAANEVLRGVVDQNKLRDAYETYLREFSSGNSRTPTPPGSPAEQFGLSERGKFLIEGSLDDTLVLYNASQFSPSITKNVRGEFVFRTESHPFVRRNLRPTNLPPTWSNVSRARLAQHVLTRATWDVTSTSWKSALTSCSSVADGFRPKPSPTFYNSPGWWKAVHSAISKSLRWTMFSANGIVSRVWR